MTSLRAMPQAACIHHLVERQAARTPAATAVMMDGQALTYATLNARANVLAHHLREIGVKAETVVAVCTNRSPDFITGALGILKAGGAYVPIDSLYPPERFEHMLTDTGAPVLLTQRHLVDRLPSQAGRRSRIICLEDLRDSQAGSEENPAPAVTPDNLAYVIYTSGSTGKPKGVAITHQAAVGHLTTMQKLWGLSGEDRVLAFASFTFDASVEQIFPALFSGATLIMRGDQGWSAAEFSSRVVELGISVADLPTAYWDQWVQLHTSRRMATEVAATLRLVVIGGEAVRAASVDRWLRSNLGSIRLVNGYGPTETTVTASIYEIPASLTSGALPAHIPIGRPLPGRTMRILDEEGKPVSSGGVGELYIGGAGLARGYLNQPELTSQRFVADPFDQEPGARLYRSGDLARALPDGTIEFLGRRDRQVKIRGFRVELGEIEEHLARHAAVRESAALLREDVPGEKRLVAYVATEDGLVPGDLRELLRGALPAYMVPSTFVTLPSLPLTSHGKVDYAALPAPDPARANRSHASTAPRSAVEDTLARIWKDLLHVEEVGIHDAFLDLGGDSLLAVTMMAAASEAGLDFDPGEFLRCQTIAELSAVVRPTGQTRPRTRAARRQTEPDRVPLTPALRRYVESPHRLSGHGVEEIVCEAQEEIDDAVLAEALTHLVAHHDALRLRLVPDGSGWCATFPTGQPVTVHRIDVAGLPPGEQQDAAAARLEELRASIDPFQGGPLRAAHVTGYAGVPRLVVLLIHHTAVDGFSEPIIVHDLTNTYQDLKRGRRPSLPAATTSFARWAAQGERLAASKELRRELAYWQGIPWELTPRLAAGDAAEISRVDEGRSHGAFEDVELELNGDQTAALVRGLPLSHNRSSSRASFHELLVTALARALGDWIGTGRLLLRIIGHGREPVFEGVNLARTVGWLTCAYPVLLDLAGTTRLDEQVHAVANHLRAVPSHGLGYGLLKHLSTEASVQTAMQTLPAPQVHLNFLGHLIDSPEGHGVLRRSARSLLPRAGRTGEVTADIRIKAYFAGGQFYLRLTYHEHAYARQSMEQLAGGIAQCLQELAASTMSAAGLAPVSLSGRPRVQPAEPAAIVA